MSFVVIIGIVVIFLLQLKNNQLALEVDSLKNEYALLNHEVNDLTLKTENDILVQDNLQTSISDLEDSILEYENQVLTLTNELDEVNESKLDLLTEIEQLSEQILMFESEDSSPNDSIFEPIQFGTWESGLLRNNFFVRIGLIETDVIDVLGQPLETIEELTSDGLPDYYSNRPIKKYIYDDISIEFIQAAGESDYRVCYIETQSENIKTLRNIQIGSTVDDIERCYKDVQLEYIDGTVSRCVLYEPTNYRDGIIFDIVEGKVAKVNVFLVFD